MFKSFISNLLNWGIVQFIRTQIGVSNKFILLVDIGIPVFGALVLGWEFIIVYYFVELFVAGIFTLLKILISSNISFSEKLSQLGCSLGMFLFMNLVYSIFVFVFSFIFFNSAVIPIALESGSNERINELLISDVVLPFLQNDLLQFVLFISTVYIFRFILVDVRNRANDKGTDLYDQHIQRRVVIFHLALIAIGFIVGIPNTIATMGGYFVYQLTGLDWIFEITVRLSNAIAAIILGLIAVWNNNRMRRVGMVV